MTLVVLWLLIGLASGQRVFAICPVGLDQDADSQARHLRGIETHRRLLEETFREPSTTPLLPEDLNRFSGLSYFPIDRSYLLPARFQPSTGRTTFELPTFNGERQRFSEYGTLSFCLTPGTITTLMLYQRQDAGALGKLTVIAPFRDQTNGADSYSGGRYLKFMLPLAEPMLIDFNRAVNPQCAYNPNLPCPIPPRRNWLTGAIPVGERDFSSP